MPKYHKYFPVSCYPDKQLWGCFPKQCFLIQHLVLVIQIKQNRDIRDILRLVKYNFCGDLQPLFQRQLLQNSVLRYIAKIPPNLIIASNSFLLVRHQKKKHYFYGIHYRLQGLNGFSQSSITAVSKLLCKGLHLLSPSLKQIKDFPPPLLHFLQ